MKKLMLCGAVASALAMTACSSNKSKDQAVFTPVVTKQNVVEVAAYKEQVAEDLKQDGQTLKSFTMKVGNKEYKDGNIDLGAQFGQGIHKTTFNNTAVATDDATKKDVTLGERGDLYLFQQNYSAFVAIQPTHETVDGKERAYTSQEEDDKFDTFIIGEATKVLPKGKASYAGNAQIHGEKDAVHNAKFTYSIDFDAEKGSGKVANVAGKDITLAEANIEDINIRSEYTGVSSFKGFLGTATRDGKDGHYVLGIFGPNADEVTGHVSVDNDKYDGFIGGKKQ